VVPVERTEACTTEDEFLTWETLTLCFYDTKLIDMSLMSQQEIDWINAYHKKVYELTAPHLSKEEAEWLKTKCKEIRL
ncbi:MAG: M24 family metallopeptidase C-terminal domain-containing protein, partial [Paludibacteraceae bacterium]|nr:M24 family metallopeptidase C-terminal domain-containing protein [Paludibacteraceae bacterium]